MTYWNRKAEERQAHADQRMQELFNKASDLGEKYSLDFEVVLLIYRALADARFEGVKEGREQGQDDMAHIYSIESYWKTKRRTQ